MYIIQKTYCWFAMELNAYILKTLRPEYYIWRRNCWKIDRVGSFAFLVMVVRAPQYLTKEMRMINMRNNRKIIKCYQGVNSISYLKYDPWMLDILHFPKRGTHSQCKIKSAWNIHSPVTHYKVVKSGKIEVSFLIEIGKGRWQFRGNESMNVLL